MTGDPTIDSSLSGILASLGQAPDLIDAMLQRLPSSRWNYRASDDDWSFVENLCHLRDIESQGYAVRIARILEEESPFLPEIDGVRLAIQSNYNDQDALQALRDFRIARANNVARLSELDAGSLARLGTLEQGGVITLRKLIDIIHEHDEHHQADLVRLCEFLSNDGL
jgi:hypothetical protein